MIFKNTITFNTLLLTIRVTKYNENFDVNNGCESNSFHIFKLLYRIDKISTSFLLANFLTSRDKISDLTRPRACFTVMSRKALLLLPFFWRGPTPTLRHAVLMWFNTSSLSSTMVNVKQGYIIRWEGEMALTSLINGCKVEGLTVLNLRERYIK